MATVFAASTAARVRPIESDLYERVLGYAACALLAAALVAIARGHAEWSRVPPMIWAHLLTVLVAVGLTPVLLLRRRGDGRHRLLGRVWVVAMLATAVSTFFVQASHPGHFSFIHILSAWVLLQAPLIWWSAKTHRVARHRAGVRAMVTGALVIAGFFTFPFGRMLGHWLMG